MLGGLRQVCALPAACGLACGCYGLSSPSTLQRAINTRTSPNHPPPFRAPRSGLRWDLANLEMRFGGLVSTSNAIEADEVRVQSDTDLVWTTRLRAEATPKP